MAARGSQELASSCEIALAEGVETRAEELAEVIYCSLHAAMAPLTGGLSPAALSAAYLDWAVHLATSPGRSGPPDAKGDAQVVRASSYASRCAFRGASAECIAPLPQDKRFAGEAWQHWPFNLISQSFLLQQQWWHNATTGVGGVTGQHERLVEFASRQLLDMVAPSNFPWANPEVIARTLETGGANLARGMGNLVEDLSRPPMEPRPRARKPSRSVSIWRRRPAR